MRDAIAGALLIAAVSTLGDFVWAGLHLRHRVIYGLMHGTILFACMGAYFGSLKRWPLQGAMYGAAIGLVAAGSFYVLAPIAGYSVMFVVWAFIWIALAFLVRNPPVVWRGVLAMAGSGLGFYAISGIWRPFDPQGWDYAVHFLSWTVAYLPGFLALLVARGSTLGGATGMDPAQERLASGD
ncbi:MAG TPA: hypothetical protein VFO48_11540 [Vicinamibacterales bacterium]|nr:hypothetical protein [Vicinamibacterales bacterium]